MDDEALSWVVLLTSGESTEADHAEFRAWRDHSVEHRQALARARTIWAQVGAALPNVPSGETRPQAWRKHGSSLAMAASLILCLVLGAQYQTNWRYDYVTAAGERRVISLADGSRIVMSGDTALNIDFDGTGRRIELARGQGLFHAAHDQQRPFTVDAAGHRVRDIGTVFDVEHRSDAVKVVVVDGAVETMSGDARALLTAGQGVTIAQKGLGAVKAVNASAATAWSGGRLVVQNQTLEQILDALEPHYPGKIFLLNDNAGQRRLSVVIDLERIDDWLAGLAKIKAVQMKRVGKFVILT